LSFQPRNLKSLYNSIGERIGIVIIYLFRWK